MLSYSWVPGRAIPMSYDMHSHLIILKKNTPHTIPRHSGFGFFSAAFILFIEVLQHPVLKQTACDHCFR